MMQDLRLASVFLVPLGEEIFPHKWEQSFSPQDLLVSTDGSAGCVKWVQSRNASTWPCPFEATIIHLYYCKINPWIYEWSSTTGNRWESSIQQVGHPMNGIATLAIIPTRWFTLIILVRKHRTFHTVGCGFKYVCFSHSENLGKKNLFFFTGMAQAPPRYCMTCIHFS